MESLRELGAQLPAIEEKIRSTLPIETSGIWTWVVGLIVFAVIVSVASSVAGRLAGWVARAALRRPRSQR